MRLSLRPILAIAISLGGLALLLVVLRLVQGPVEITVVERERSGMVDMSLGAERWAIDGFGKVARDPQAPDGIGSRLLLAKPAGGHLSAGRHFNEFDRAAVAFSFLPDGTDTRLQLSTQSFAGISLTVSFDRDGRVRLEQDTARHDLGPFDPEGWNSVYLAWDKWGGALAYTLRVGELTLLDGHKTDGPQDVRTLKFTLLDDRTAHVESEGRNGRRPRSTWLLDGAVMSSGLHFDFGRLPDGETVRILGVDGRVVGESRAQLRPLAETMTPFQIAALDGSPGDRAVRFQLLRDGIAVADPSAVLLDARPGDVYEVTTVWQPNQGEAGGHGLWQLAMVGALALAAFAYLALAPRIDVATGSVAVLMFALGRLFATEVSNALGIAVGPGELIAIAAVVAGPGIGIGSGCLATRGAAAARLVRGSLGPSAVVAVVVVVVTMGSALAVGALPTPDGAAHAAYVGHRWLQHGEAPYGDQWAIGAPGLYLFNGLISDLFGHGVNALLMARLAVVATALLLAARLGYRLGGRSGSAVAGLTLGITGSWVAFGGAGLSAPMIATLPILAALITLHAGGERREPAADLVAGALLATAVAIDVQAIFVVPVAVFWVWPSERIVAPWPRVGRIAFGTSVIVLFVAGVIAGRGLALDALELMVVERSRLAELWLTTNALPVDPGWAYVFWVPGSVGIAYVVVAAAITILVAKRAWWPAALVTTAVVAQHVALKLVYRFEPSDYYPFVWVLVLALVLLATQRTRWMILGAPASAVVGLAVLAGVFVIPDQYRTAADPETNEAKSQGAILAATIPNLVSDGASVFMWAQAGELLRVSDVAVAGGFGRPSSGVTVDGRAHQWLAAIRRDLPDVLVTPDGFTSAELRTAGVDLGYVPIESPHVAYDVYVRRLPVLGVAHTPGSCSGGSQIAVGGLAPSDLVQLVAETEVIAAAMVGDRNGVAKLSVGAEMANTRLELVHARTLQTVWVSDTFDRLCAGDRLDLLAGTRS